MSDNQTFSHQIVGWALAAGIAFVAFLLLLVLGDFGFVQAAFLSAIVFVAVGGLIALVFTTPLPKLGEVPPPGTKVSTKPQGGASAGHSAPAAPAPTAPAPAPAAPAAAEAAPTAAEVKPSTPLAGEAELAERKGTWKYEGDNGGAAAAPAPAAAPADGEGVQPEAMSEAREGGPDNLKEIKGVGPALEKLLHELGIFHFDQIAGWGASEIAWMDENLKGFKGRVTRDDWVEQAKTLAAGGETEFSKRVDEGDVY